MNINLEKLGKPNHVSFLRPPSLLPKHLSSFVDGSSDDDDVGVIYVAFGTAVNASEMSEKKRQMFVNVFRYREKIPFPTKFNTKIYDFLTGV